MKPAEHLARMTVVWGILHQRWLCRLMATSTK